MARALPSTARVTEPTARILLVDDNPTNLQVLFRTLDGRGYKLLAARNGEEALSIAHKARPELILLDIMMPGIDGFEVCRRLKADPVTCDTAVVFLSALGETKDKVRGLDLGAVDYVSKPFQAEEVLSRVNTHLTIQRLQRDLARRNQELESANARMKRDLDAAARVQRALLPASPPVTPHARFAWQYHPCDELAGDSLNAFNIDDRYVCLYVIDVSGHGVSSALLSVAVTRSLSLRPDRSSLVIEPGPGPGERSIVSPAEVAGRLNAIYPMESTSRQYFTLVYGVLDTHTGQLRFVSSGHPGPVRVRRNGAAEIFDVPAIPIGMLDGIEYTDTVLDLQPGDRLYLYSDGVTDETNATDQEFGRDRLRTAVEAGMRGTLEESVGALVDDLTAWRGHDHFSDDITILGVEICEP